MTLMRASLVAERYGRAHYGAIGGALALFVSGAAGSYTGSYPELPMPEEP